VTQCGHARIGERHQVRGQRNILARAPKSGYREPVRQIGDLDLGAQLVHRQPPGEVAKLAAWAVEQEVLFPRQHEEVEQHLALRRQQRRECGCAGFQRFDGLRQQAVQKRPRVLSTDAKHTAIRENRHASIVHEPPS